MNPMLKQALKYVKEYKWSVIPVKDKVPQVESWSEYRTRFPTMQELETWFGNTTNGIGIVTGKLSNLSVVDVDGFTDLQLNSACQVKTPKGKHFYFRYQEGVKNHVRILPEIDIRSEGGFVVGPPTIGYRFNNPYFAVGGIPKFPIHIIPKKEESAITKEPGWLGTSLLNLKNGNRDDTFTKVIGRLHRDGHTADTIRVLLTPYALSSGFGVIELEKKIEHIIRAYPNETKRNEEGSDDVSTFLQDITPVEWIIPGLIARSSIGFVAGLPETFKTWLMLDLAIECARGGGKWLGRFNVKGARVLFVDQERHKSETQRRFNCLLRAKGLDPKLLRDSLFIRCGSTTRLDLDDSFRAFKARMELIQPDLVIVDSWVSFKTTDDNDRSVVQKVIERVKELRDEFKCTILFIDHESKSVYSDEAKKEAPNAYRMAGSVGKIAAAEGIFTVRKYDPTTCMVYNTKNTLAPCIESFNVTVQDVPNGVVVASL